MPLCVWRGLAFAAGALVLTASCANIIGVDGDFHEVSAGGAGPASSSVGGTAGATSSSTVGGMGGTTATGGAGGAPGPCGNGTLDPGEQCEDSNVVGTDGCSNSCQLEGAADMCPTGANIALGPAGIWILDDGSGRNSSTSTPCGGNSAPDLVYQITPSQGGMLAFDVTSTYNGTILAVRNNCDGNQAARCETGDMMVSTTFPVQQGNSFHVIISGTTGGSGQFELHIYYQ